jgi:serine/threonine-protein kinase
VLPVSPPKIEKFGRYYLLDRIAIGGMAEVYRAATQGVEGFRRTFVVKRILAEKAQSPAFIRMFCDEARISALLHHPNIVQVYDFGHVRGSYFLAMEYLLGKDLSSVMRLLRAAKSSMPPGVATFIAQQVATGLHHAHTLRNGAGTPLAIVHRDVTPSNIMLLYGGTVKVLDFGIAKASTAARTTEAEGGGVKGKFGYLSPEQARATDVDARADVFALGVTMWEMLAGRRLFSGKNELETLRNVLQKPVPPPSTMRPGISAELDRVVLRALERDREGRYQSAQELADDCEQILRDQRYESQSLRRLLDDLFGDESSSVSLDVPELPDDLSLKTLSAPLSVSGAVARDEQSLEIEVVEPSVPAGRPRSPAPPFGVMTADERSPHVPARPRGGGLSRGAWVACAVALVAGALAIGLGARRVAVPASVASPTSTPEVVALPPAPPPPAAEAPAPPATIKVDLDSQPSGATVLDHAGAKLGVTPLAIEVPRSQTLLALTLAKLGYERVNYELMPDHDTVVRVQLPRARRLRPAAPVHRYRDQGDGDLTIDPF